MVKLITVGIFTLFIMPAFSQVDNIIHYNYTNGCLPDSVTRCIFAPDSNELWVGTNKGLSHLVNGNWQLCSGLLSNGINDIIEDKNGNIWIATDYGLAKFKNDQFTVFITSNSSLPCNYIKSLVCDESGNIWIATIGCGLLKYDGSSFTSYNRGNSSIISDSILDLAIYQGKIYCVCINGISIFDYSSWQEIYPNDFADHYVTIQNIAIDNSGNIFLGGFNSGLAKYDGSDFYFYDEADPRFHKMILGLYNFNGIILFCDFGYGLAQFEENTIKHFDTLNKVLGFEKGPLNGINRTTSDKYGNLYLGTSSKGVYKLSSKLIGVGIKGSKENANKITFYPNPVENKLNIHFEKNTTLNNISVYDIYGRNVLNFNYPGENVKQLVLDIDNIESGLYVIKIQYNNNTFSNFKISKK